VTAYVAHQPEESANESRAGQAGTRREEELLDCLRPKGAAHGGAHYFERRRLVREETAEAAAPWCNRPRDRPAPHARRGQRAHPPGAAGSVHQVEAACRRAALSGSPAAVGVLEAGGRRVDRRCRARALRARPPRGFPARGPRRRNRALAPGITPTGRAGRPLPPRPPPPPRARSRRAEQQPAAAPSTPSWRRAQDSRDVGVVAQRALRAPSRTLLQAPTRAHTSVFPRHVSFRGSLCGTVTFPAPPTARGRRAGRAALGADARQRGRQHGVQTQDADRGVCHRRESEWRPGSPSPPADAC